MDLTSFPTPLSAEAISSLVEGRLVGANVEVSKVSSAREPKSDSIVLLAGGNIRDKALALQEQGVKLLLVEEKNESLLKNLQIPFIVVKSGTPALAVILEQCTKDKNPNYVIDEKSSIHHTAKISPNVYIGPFCVIEEGVTIESGVILHSNIHVYKDSFIGKDSVIHSSCSIREGSKIGRNCLLHNNVVIGADGFGFTPDKGGIRKVPQVGTVEIGNHVEIGAGTCIDRGAIDPTRIGDFTKIDNQVQIGHNVQVGCGVIICAGTKIGGSTVIQNGVVIGGNVGVADHLEIVTGVRVAGGSGVNSSLLEPGDYSGYPVMPVSKWRRLQVALQREFGLRKRTKKGGE